MKVLLHVKITPKDIFIFENKLKEAVGNLYAEDILLIDIDNWSEPDFVNYVYNIINGAEKIFVYVETISEETSGVLRKIFEALIEKKEQVTLIKAGENEVIQRLLKPLQKQTYENTDLERMLKGFLQSEG
ncbi:MAG: hypothetical protein ACK4ND_02495 [Cytophagaceae bacterium]